MSQATSHLSRGMARAIHGCDLGRKLVLKAYFYGYPHCELWAITMRADRHRPTGGCSYNTYTRKARPGMFPLPAIHKYVLSSIACLRVSAARVKKCCLVMASGNAIKLLLANIRRNSNLWIPLWKQLIFIPT